MVRTPYNKLDYIFPLLNDKGGISRKQSFGNYKDYEGYMLPIHILRDYLGPIHTFHDYSLCVPQKNTEDYNRNYALNNGLDIRMRQEDDTTVIEITLL